MGTEPGHVTSVAYSPSSEFPRDLGFSSRCERPAWGGLTDAPAGLSLVIPAYNEADRIRPTLDSYLKGLTELGVAYEVLVVIDGFDNTLDVVTEYAAQGVQGIRFSRKLGRGGAVFEGFRLAKYSLIAYADADGSIPISDGLQLIRRALGGSPVVVASRRASPKLVVVPEPWLKRVASLTWFLLSKAFLGLRVKDSHCGFKVFDRQVVQMLLRRVTVTNRTFEVGMMYHVEAAGVPVEEVPVAYVHDTRTRMPLGKAIPVMFLTLLGMFLANRTKVSPEIMNRVRRRFNAKWSSV